MGNQNQASKDNPQGSRKKTQKKDSLKDIYQEQYNKTYQELKTHPNFFSDYLHQSPNFGKNLLRLFPKALENPQEYFQMVTYLRRYEAVLKINKQAEQNSKSSTLLDRFFMICLGNLSFQEFKNTKLPKKDIQTLLLDYYGLFIENPKAGTLAKAVKFIEMQEQFKSYELIPVKSFSQKFRQHFPHVQKYLKDYYFAKFHQGKKDFRILKHFNSKILNEDSIILALRIPQISKSQITQLYNSDDFGIGFHAIEKKLVGYTGPWLLIVEHIQKSKQICIHIDSQGQKQRYVFGTYQNGPVKNLNVFQGDLTGFMFSLQPNIRYMTTDRGDGGQNYYLVNGAEQKVTKRRRGIGFGGNNQMQNFKLWLDEDLDKSKVFNGNDATYGYGALAGSGTSNLSINRMQIWGLGGKQNLKDQQQYWQERYEQIMKRRKVDKKQFFDQSSGLFFEKTLAHRDQVYGQIQKPQKKEQNKRQF